MIWLVSTLINYPLSETDIYLKQFYDMCRAISLGLLIEFFADRPNDLISGLLLNCEVAIYSYVFALLFKTIEPEKITHPLLNTLVLWQIPSVFLSFAHAFINKKYIRSIIMLLSCIFVTVYVWSATTVAAFLGIVFIFILGIILSRFSRLKYIKLHLSLLLLSSFLINVFIVKIYSYNPNDYHLISLFIEKFLRKTTSFTGRDVIWIEAIRMIKQKLLFGYGFRPGLSIVQTAGTKMIPHAHNQILQCLLSSGLLGLCAFVVFHAVLAKKIDNSDNGLLCLVAIACVFGISVTYIAEAYKKFFIFYMVFFMAYHVDDIVLFSRINKDSVD